MDEYKKHSLKKLSEIRDLLYNNYPEWLIPNDISHVVNDALEGWLKQKGITPKWGNGIISMSCQLKEIGENELSSNVGSIIAKATYLELELTDEDSLMYQNREKNWTIDLWKKKVEKLLEDAENFIRKL